MSALPAEPALRQSGVPAVAAAQQAGIECAFTLSGGHIFPIFDAALRAVPPLRLIDVRHEASAVFAAEAAAKLTRRPGLAVLTAGPGVTNAISPLTQAFFSAVPLVAVGGRAAALTWGRGSLQELDQPPLLAPVTKSARTVDTASRIGAEMAAAIALAAAPHRGPVFLDIPIDILYQPAADLPVPSPEPVPAREPDPEAVGDIARLLAEAERPVLVLGTDVWMERAEATARAVAEELGIPVVTNGMGRGILPPGHRLQATSARRVAFSECDLVVVAGAPLDFRMAYGRFGPGGAARVVHLADSPEQVCTHRPLDGAASGDLSRIFEALGAVARARPWTDWTDRLAAASAEQASADQALMTSPADPIHPARILGELAPLLGEDAIVIGDGGDFVSWAGKLLHPARPGGWLDAGPFGCLGSGLGAAIGARTVAPDRQLVLLLGDGAAGMSLMDFDTLVRHRLPAVIVVANNAGWGLERTPMRQIYGYDALVDLRPGTPYDHVARALGGDGETVTSPSRLAGALRRAFAAEGPYLVNVQTDPEAGYPRATTGL